MDWTAAVDGYCERVGPAFWAEPVNALTNLAFVFAALYMWPRVGGIGRWLCIVLFAIGVGSFLFHTFAQPWAGLADVLPILVFILIYIFAAKRDFWGLGRWASLGLTVLFVPYAVALTPVFGLVPGLGGSAGYAPVPLLIAIYAVLLRHRAPQTARGLAMGVGLLVLSLVARTLDAPLCGALPVGTHFLWHVLNAVMLGWMIEVWRRHMLARARAAR
ncbi:ceramidase domain-containing protein [Allosediminivita pacifica]|uniref:Ceramidase n=1 Tax=Allosediminivita pacifica TaxID=1267769 RepID=A0A2T6B119_9RHOB|nr:ceramidase domain-containing protein [Allosediminivita pacifica]PTX49722.1 ceramidase [Allosediminivita pacifica]GGB04098.1 membrane protein [Allosediminivita pacifica]